MLLCSPHSLWREVQDAAGGLRSVCPHPVMLAGPWQRLSCQKTGNVRFPSAGPQGLRTATVFGFEIQMTNTHALFPKVVCCIYTIIKITDFEVFHCEVWDVTLLKSLYQEPQTITVPVGNWYWCVNLLKEVYTSSLKKLCC